MIKLKLDQLAKKIDKSISDIAKETGINRNTITSLFHGKVDGIKFSTLNTLCDFYNIAVDDLLEFQNDKKSSEEKEEIYRQEGEAVPFTMFPPALSFKKLSLKYFNADLGSFDCFLKENYWFGYFRKKDMFKLAEEVYQKYSSPEKMEILFRACIESSTGIKYVYQNTTEKEILNLSDNELKEIFQKIRDEYKKFWAHSIFIDAFDVGFDSDTIKKISVQYNLTSKEVGILTTPREMTFNNERILSLLEIVKIIKKKKIVGSELKEYIKENEDIKKYIKDFDYHKSNYARANHINLSDIEEEINKYLKDEEIFDEEYKKLKNYFQEQEKAEKEILREHKLKSNPLFFFQKLTYWREHRKMINLMGIHILHYILSSIEEKTGIPKKYLEYLSLDEVDNALKGLVSKDTLAYRREKGIMVSFDGENYKIFEGDEAISLKDDLEKKMVDESQKDIISGQVASQGYAKGIARVILEQTEFDKFKDGEILITGMTRPEFVPLMKKALAIVTNEGGITCHAAIVSRELGKPCIIGTQNATEKIHTGDLIEVRANHGTVRIIEKSK